MQIRYLVYVKGRGYYSGRRADLGPMFTDYIKEAWAFVEEKFAAACAHVLRMEFDDIMVLRRQWKGGDV